MKQKHVYRGFRILHQAAGNGFRIKVLAQNEVRYIVLIHRYFFGFRVFSKAYTFENAALAQQMFEKLTYLKIFPLKHNLVLN